MAATFPRTKRLGYDVHEVEEFLRLAREAYSTPFSEPAPMTAEDIRLTAFTMRKGGYAPEAVDAALERLEDAFAARARDRALAEAGAEAWYTEVRGTAQAIVDRIARPPRQRFRRVGPLVTGYDPDDVDRFTDRIAAYFGRNTPLTADEVRAAAFRPRRGGYQEAQVDLLLDSVTRVILAVR